MLEKLSPVIGGKKFPLAPPTLCIEERHRHRAMFAEDITFFRRTSSLSGKPIVSLYDPAKPYPVYANDEWWSDAWDELGYGRAFDPGRSFFEQFTELYDAVPKMATFNEACENCDFCASASTAKNCYYSSRAHRSEDIYYSEAVTGYNNTLCDCLRCQRSEVLYECVQCVRCHTSSSLYRCADVSDSHFCIALRNCQNCLFCHNLHNKQYHIANQPVSKEEFVQAKAAALDGRFSTLQKNLELWRGQIDQTIWQDFQSLNSDNCRGDALLNCNNCHECYNCFNCIDCRYCWDLSPSEQCVGSMDLTRGGIGELLYNSVSLGGGNYAVICSVKCRKCAELQYCIDCYSSKNCFGCTGLKSKHYCILNKQYTKTEYEELVPKIIAHMQRTGEWGEFFPPSMSPFAYNHSLAMQIFPIAEEEAKRRGWQWSNYEPHIEAAKNISASDLPDCIDNIPDDILNWAVRCSTSDRLFRVIPQELAMQRNFHVPVHREHPDVRMKRRRGMLNPYALYPRKCAKCRKAIETSYPPSSKAIVECRECYLKEVY